MKRVRKNNILQNNILQGTGAIISHDIDLSDLLKRTNLSSRSNNARRSGNSHL